MRKICDAIIDITCFRYSFIGGIAIRITGRNCVTANANLYTRLRFAQDTFSIYDQNQRIDVVSTIPPVAVYINRC